MPVKKTSKKPVIENCLNTSSTRTLSQGTQGFVLIISSVLSKSNCM